MDTIAAVDIGTNTFCMLVSERKSGGGFIPILREREVVRLGEGCKTSLKISDQAVTRGIGVLKRFFEKMKCCKVINCAAVATGILRSAVNASEFLEKAEKECNLTVKLISGKEEALLTLRGVEMVFPSVKMEGSWIIIDIGGGSTELICCENGDVRIIESIDLGVVTLADMIDSDPPHREELREMEQEIDRAFMSVAEKIKSQMKKKPFLVGTAGTVTTLAAMHQALVEYQPEKINGYLLAKYSIQEIYDHLIEMKEDAREGFPGLEKGRGKVIVPGCAILLTVMNAFQIEQASVSDYGLLEGITRDLFDALDTQEKLV